MKTKLQNTATIDMKKIARVLGAHSFLFIIIFVIIDLVLGGIIFYKYVYLAQIQDSQINGSLLKFDEKTYQKIIEQVGARK